MSSFSWVYRYIMAHDVILHVCACLYNESRYAQRSRGRGHGFRPNLLAAHYNAGACLGGGLGGSSTPLALRTVSFYIIAMRAFVRTINALVRPRLAPTYIKIPEHARALPQNAEFSPICFDNDISHISLIFNKRGSSHSTLLRNAHA